LHAVNALVHWLVIERRLTLQLFLILFIFYGAGIHASAQARGRRHAASEGGSRPVGSLGWGARGPRLSCCEDERSICGSVRTSCFSSGRGGSSVPVLRGSSASAAALEPLAGRAGPVPHALWRTRWVHDRARVWPSGRHIRARERRAGMSGGLSLRVWRGRKRINLVRACVAEPKLCAAR